MQVQDSRERESQGIVEDGSMSLCSPEEHTDFESFVRELGRKSGQQLKYCQCNKHLKLKQSEYIGDAQVLEYYQQVFSKRTNTAVRRKWHIKDKFILIWIVFKLCERKGNYDFRMKHSEWAEVASILRLPMEFLMRKWICLIRHTTCHFPWSHEEENCLTEHMHSNSMEPKWSDLAIKIYEKSQSQTLRTCKDIREHWKNYLDPKLKKAVWTSEQDSQLLGLVQLYGKKWSSIAKIIQGRTENQVKNRYLALSRKMTRTQITHLKSEDQQPQSSSLQDEVKSESMTQEKITIKVQQPLSRLETTNTEKEYSQFDLDYSEEYLNLPLSREDSVTQAFFQGI